MSCQYSLFGIICYLKPTRWQKKKIIFTYYHRRGYAKNLKETTKFSSHSSLLMSTRWWEIITTRDAWSTGRCVTEAITRKWVLGGKERSLKAGETSETGRHVGCRNTETTACGKYIVCFQAAFGIKAEPHTQGGVVYDVGSGNEIVPSCGWIIRAA